MSEMQGCEVSFRQMKEEGFNCRSPIQVALCLASVEDNVLEDFIEGEEGADKFNMASYIDKETKENWAFLKRAIDERTCMDYEGGKKDSFFKFNVKSILTGTKSERKKLVKKQAELGKTLKRKRNNMDLEFPHAAYFGCKDETCDDHGLDHDRKLTFEKQICSVGDKIYNKQLEMADSSGYRPVEI